MHSFLIIGQTKNLLDKEVEKIIKKYSLKKIDFNGQKIEEIRKLNSFISLSLKEKTGIVLQNIENSTNEALNAFLKNLEEPQENLYFILTSSSIHKVLPTIISRCQIIHVSESKKVILNEQIEKFEKMDTSEKFTFFESIRKREDAIIFFENLIFFLHQKLLNNGNNFKYISDKLEKAQETLSSLEKNGNVNLHLINYAINTDNFESLTLNKHEV